MRKFKGKKPIEGRNDVWPEEFRLKVLTTAKLGILKKLTKNRPLKEEA